MTIQRESLDFSVQSKEYQAKQLNAEVCKNWYAVSDPVGKFKRVLFPFPGAFLWSSSNDGKIIRGLFSLNEVLYAVVGDEFRIYNDFGNHNTVGRLKTSVGSVKFAANDNQIFISDFSDGYVYQLVDTVTRKAGTFFQIINASSFVGTPVFVGIGIGINELTAIGPYVGSVNRTFLVQIDGQATASITTPEFIGTGINDLTVSGTFTGLLDENFLIEIDGVSNPNTFRWSVNAGVTWNATLVPITGGAIVLKDGVSITFANKTGHILADKWIFTAYSASNFDTFRWSINNGASWIATDIQITGAYQLLMEGIQIIFVHKNGHVKNDRWTFNVTIDSAFFPPITPIYIDGIGVFIKSNTQRFYITSQEDFSVINAVDYAQTNAFPDDVVCGVSINEEIFFIKSYTTEIWWNAGTSPFPLQRRPNILIHWGTRSPLTLATASNNAIFWLAQNINGGRVVVMMFNYNITIISDKALNDKLESYNNIDDAFGFVMEWTGKIFYFLTIPSADVTWVYDFDDKRWRQRTSRRLANDIKEQDFIEGRYIASCYVYHNGKCYIGDYRKNHIYQLRNDYFLEDGQPIINEAISPPFHIKLNRLSIYSLQLVLQAATADNVTTNPIVMLQYSTDGGYTWSKELTSTIGGIGEYSKRCKFNKLGYGREFIFRIRISDSVYKVLMGAIIEFEDVGS